MAKAEGAPQSEGPTVEEVEEVEGVENTKVDEPKEETTVE
jgi:hypothetical protein